MNPKIDLMIIGAQKAGTSSLLYYLGQHPDIITHYQTEFSFFVNDAEFEQGFEKILKSQFPAKKYTITNKVVAKNVTVSMNKKAMKRLYEHNPDCKVVYIIRNPIERAISSFNMEVSKGWLKEDINYCFQSALDDHAEGKYNMYYNLFIKPGEYEDRINEIQHYFQKGNLSIIDFKELINNPKKITDMLFDELKLAPDNNIDFQPKNEAHQIQSGTVKMLKHHFGNEKNPIKKIVKQIIPYRLYHSVTDKILTQLGQ